MGRLAGRLRQALFNWLYAQRGDQIGWSQAGCGVDNRRESLQGAEYETLWRHRGRRHQVRLRSRISQITSTLRRFPTTTPEETISRVIAFCARAPSGAIDGGRRLLWPAGWNPARLRLAILPPHRNHWGKTNLVGPLRQHWGCQGLRHRCQRRRIGEHCWGATRLDTFVYLTIGTGLGVAAWSTAS